jgi:hypothetical protein
MRSLTIFVAGKMFLKTPVLSFTGILALIFAIPLSAQNCPTNDGVRTICEQIGNAEVVSVTSPFGTYPTLQPVVYWHDDEWKIDMLPQPTSDGELRMQITSKSGSAKIVNFQAVFFAQVDSITRNPGDKAIILGEANGTSSVFSIIDLKLGKQIDGGLLYHPSISPNRRFLLYNDWYTPHSEFFENRYTLYDTLKTPEENTCGYGDNNIEYKRHHDLLGGIQVYPYQVTCLDLEDDDDDNTDISDFIWSSNSSKVVFADVKSGVMSLILVKMPHGERDEDHDCDHDRGHDKNRDQPRTLTYSFTGAENVCAGAATCDYNNVRSIAWNGDSVNIALVQANPSGPAIVKNLAIPLSKFVPLAK